MVDSTLLRYMDDGELDELLQRETNRFTAIRALLMAGKSNLEAIEEAETRLKAVQGEIQRRVLDNVV